MIALFMKWHFGFPFFWENVGERDSSSISCTDSYLRHNLQTGFGTPQVSCIVDTHTFSVKVNWPELEVKH
jgi:hypothetical protein